MPDHDRQLQAMAATLPGPEEGGGPPLVLPWTLVVPEEGWTADLEHGATLPRVGELIEYIGDVGARRRYRVVDVVHSLQRSASDRPPVHSESQGPNTLLDAPGSTPPLIVRAGLPRVIAAPEPDAEPEP